MQEEPTRRLELFHQMENKFQVAKAIDTTKQIVCD